MAHRALTGGPSQRIHWAGRETGGMDLDRARDFVRSNHRAVLATRTATASSRARCLVGVDEDGRLTVEQPRGGVQDAGTCAATRGPSSCVLNEFFGDWVYVEGEAEVVSLPEAMEPLVEYYRGISRRDRLDDVHYRAAMASATPGMMPMPESDRRRPPSTRLRRAHDLTLSGPCLGKAARVGRLEALEEPTSSGRPTPYQLGRGCHRDVRQASMASASTS